MSRPPSDFFLLSHRPGNLKSVGAMSRDIDSPLPVGWSQITIYTGKKNYFLLRNVQTGSGTHPACYSMCKGKGKGHPIIGHEVPEGEQMYNSTLPSTSALNGGGQSTPRPGRFTPGKDPVPIV